MTEPDHLNFDHNKWENLSLSDLAHINRYAREKVNPISQGGKPHPFFALDVNWVGILSPAIPSGR